MILRIVWIDLGWYWYGYWNRLGLRLWLVSGLGLRNKYGVVARVMWREFKWDRSRFGFLLLRRMGLGLRLWE